MKLMNDDIWYSFIYLNLLRRCEQNWIAETVQSSYVFSMISKNRNKLAAN